MRGSGKHGRKFKGTDVARNSDLRSYLPSSQHAKRGGGILAAGALALVGAALIVNRRSAAGKPTTEGTIDNAS